MVYIDAATRTQDVLSLKWALKGAGYAIGSTWHDQPTSFLKAETHWNEFRLAELQRCGELFVIFDRSAESAANLAAMAAIALSRNMPVTWIGPKLPVLEYFRPLQQFANLADLIKYLVRPGMNLAA